MEKERRKYLLNKGDKNKHSYLIIIVDNSEIIPNQITRYVNRDEDIGDILFQYACNPNLKISNIYNYDIELDAQINESNPYHVIAPYNKIEEAYNFAKQKHEGQIRKDGSAYINHPKKVAEIVKKYFSYHSRVNELITAAYLHDVVEDTDTTIEEIREKFGEYVAYLVNGVTNNDIQKKRMGKTNYLCNKMLHMDEDVLNLKLCDRLSNTLDLCNANKDFAEKYETETTIILNYLLTNKKLTSSQRELTKRINSEINNLRQQNILQLTRNQKHS